MARAAKAGKVQQTEWQEAEKDYQNLKEEHANAYDLWACLEKMDTNSGGFDVV